MHDLDAPALVRTCPRRPASQHLQQLARCTRAAPAQDSLAPPAELSDSSWLSATTSDSWLSGGLRARRARSGAVPDFVPDARRKKSGTGACLRNAQACWQRQQHRQARTLSRSPALSAAARSAGSRGFLLAPVAPLAQARERSPAPQRIVELEGVRRGHAPPLMRGSLRSATPSWSANYSALSAFRSINFRSVAHELCRGGKVRKTGEDGRAQARRRRLRPQQDGGRDHDAGGRQEAPRACARWVPPVHGGPQAGLRACLPRREIPCG